MALFFLPKRKMTIRLRKWENFGQLTDEKCLGESPFLGAANDGKREPMGGDEGVEKRNGGDSPDLGQIFSCESFHYPHPDSRMLFKIKDELHSGEGKERDLKRGYSGKSNLGGWSLNSQLSSSNHHASSNLMTIMPIMSLVIYFRCIWVFKGLGRYWLRNVENREREYIKIFY